MSTVTKCCQQQTDDYHFLFVALGNGGRAVTKFSKSIVWDKLSERVTLMFLKTP